MKVQLNAYPTDLTDAQWQEIKSMLPQPKQRGRPLEYERRSIVNAVLYTVKAGCAWRLLSKDFAPWSTVYRYYRQWCQKGLWECTHEELRERVRRAAGKKPSPTAAILDSQSVKLGNQAGERGYDANKKVVGRKRHLLVDTLRLILGILITPASVQDRDGTKRLLQPLIYALGKFKIIGADSGHVGEFIPQVKALRPWGKLH